MGSARTTITHSSRGKVDEGTQRTVGGQARFPLVNLLHDADWQTLGKYPGQLRRHDDIPYPQIGFPVEQPYGRPFLRRIAGALDQHEVAPVADSATYRARASR